MKSKSWGIHGLPLSVLVQYREGSSQLRDVFGIQAVQTLRAAMRTRATNLLPVCESVSRAGRWGFS